MGKTKSTLVRRQTLSGKGALFYISLRNRTDSSLSDYLMFMPRPDLQPHDISRLRFKVYFLVISDHIVVVPRLAPPVAMVRQPHLTSVC